MSPYRIERIDDSSVDDVLDGELRELLSTCFTKPQDIVFRERRYFKEPPAWRWLMRVDKGRLIGNIAVHNKSVVSGFEKIPIGGIAEVCVHPDFQKRGLAKEILVTVHEWLAEKQYPFAVLFGNPDVYTSSGYGRVDNVVRRDREGSEAIRVYPLVKELGSRSWPRGEVCLFGPGF